MSDSAMVHLPTLIAGALCISTSEARRGLAQGAVTVNGKREDRLDVPRYQIVRSEIRFGKRRWLALDDDGEVTAWS